MINKFIMSILFLCFVLNVQANVLSYDFSKLERPYPSEILDEHYEQLELLDSEIDALYNYALETYKEINPALRNSDYPILSSHKNYICNLDSALVKYRFKNLTLYRGSNARRLTDANFQPGFQYSENSFVSTSIDRSVALNFAKTKEPYLLDIIQTPEYVSGIWLNLLSEFPEEEILLPRQTKFEVISTKIQDNLGKKLIIRELKIIDQDSNKLYQDILGCNNFN